MQKAKLAILPVPEGRKAERRMVNLAARLRDPGAAMVDVDIMDLSTDGFMAHGVDLEVGVHVWLKLPGLEPHSCRLVWNEGGRAGFEFASPLHSATLALVLLGERKPPVRDHFGPRGLQRANLEATAGKPGSGGRSPTLT